MNSLTKDFWRHVRTAGGPSDLRDVFLLWAAEQRMTLAQAEDIWKLVCADVDEIFDRSKKADNISVEITGDDTTIKKMLSGEEPLDVLGKPEEVKDEKAEPESKDTDKEDEGSGTLLDFENEAPAEGQTEAPAPASTETGAGTLPPSDAVPEQLPV